MNHDLPRRPLPTVEHGLLVVINDHSRCSKCTVTASLRQPQHGGAWNVVWLFVLVIDSKKNTFYHWVLLLIIVTVTVVIAFNRSYWWSLSLNIFYASLSWSFSKESSSVSSDFLFWIHHVSMKKQLFGLTPRGSCFLLVVVYITPRWRGSRCRTSQFFYFFFFLLILLIRRWWWCWWCWWFFFSTAATTTIMMIIFSDSIGT